MMTKDAPKHTYPCKYMIKIIAEPDSAFPDDVLSLVQAKIKLLDHKLTISKGQKYQSLSLTLHLENEEDLKSVYDQLKAKPYIKMIL